MRYYIHVIKNYANFKGRAGLSEYWMFTLFNFIFEFATRLLDYLLGDYPTNPISGENFTFGYINLVYAIFVFLPGLAVFVRRLHDIGKSGEFAIWTFLAFFAIEALAMFSNFLIRNPILILALVILIGLAFGIWFIVLMCTASVPGPNKWGPNPNGIGNEEVPEITDDSATE